MSTKSLMAAFAMTFMAGPALANAEFEPNYSSDFRDFPDFSYFVKACDSNNQLVELAVAFDISWKDHIEAIRRVTPSLPEPGEGQDLYNYYDNLDYVDRVKAAEKYAEHFDALVQSHVEELSNADQVTEQKTATMMEDDFYEAFPQLSRNLATISRKIAKAENWRNITGAFMDVRVTPSAQYCNGNPAPQIQELKW